MPDLFYERNFMGPVIGLDEAGRGPWAGPVTVTAIWLCPSSYDDLPADINDSKKIKPVRRAGLAHFNGSTASLPDGIDYCGKD